MMTTKALKLSTPTQTKIKHDNTDNFNIDTRLVDVNWNMDDIFDQINQSRKSQKRITTLSFFIANKNIELVVDVLETNVLGRSYPQSDYFNGIDFSAFDAYTLGVSRCHLILKHDNGKLLVLDNNSTNGTFLNHRRLVPTCPYIIEHNDHLQMGELEILVKIN